MKTFNWLDVERIGEELADAFPEIEPFGVNFVELRALVEKLDGFCAESEHPVNERILEEIQRHWDAERRELELDDD